MNSKKPFIFFVLLLTTVAQADVVWPALLTESKISSVPIIILSLVIEFFVLKWLFKLNIKNTILYTFVVNLASTLLGCFLRPLSGILYEFSLGEIINTLFNWGTFNPVAWVFVPIIGSVVSTFIELSTIRIIWKHKFQKRNFFYLYLANLATTAIATIWVIFNRTEM
jgi:hypothetical protein